MKNDLPKILFFFQPNTTNIKFMLTKNLLLFLPNTRTQSIVSSLVSSKCERETKRETVQGIKGTFTQFQNESTNSKSAIGKIISIFFQFSKLVPTLT